MSFESVTNPCLTRPVTSERIVLDSSPFPAVTVTFSHRSSTFAAPLNKLSPFRRQLCIVQKIIGVTLKPKCHQNYQLFKRLSFSLGWSLILILRKYSSVLFNRLHKFHPIRFLVFFFAGLLPLIRKMNQKTHKGFKYKFSSFNWTWVLRKGSTLIKRKMPDWSKVKKRRFIQFIRDGSIIIYAFDTEWKKKTPKKSKLGPQKLKLGSQKWRLGPKNKS